MIIDGRAAAAKIVADIKAETAGWKIPPRLTVFTCAPNFETQKFLTIKERQSAEAGITLNRIELPDTITLQDVAGLVGAAALECDGIIIQFPFPHLATADLIPLIPATHDVDVFTYAGELEGPLPPVVGAIDYLANTHELNWEGKEVVVVGQGRLVGAPAAAYANSCGANVTVLTKERHDHTALLKADIVILGAGVPGLVKTDMVKDGVVVFDAGTTEEGGMLVGDADSGVAENASLFTPVPGGIGPITVAILLKNVLHCARANRK